MPSGIGEGSRSIVVTVEATENLDARVANWLGDQYPHAVFSVAELANPGRDGGAMEQVLAIDGLTERSLNRLLSDLHLIPSTPPFSSHS